MIDKEILKLLRPLKRKYYIGRIINYIFHGFHFFAIALLLMTVLSKIKPIPYIMDKSIRLLVLSILFTIVFSIYKRPRNIEIAKIIDSFGLKERVVTSFETSLDDSAFSSMQKKDTIKHLRDDSLKKNIKVKYPKKVIISTLIILFATIIIGNISTKSVIIARDIEKDGQIIEDEKENIEKVISEIKEDKILSEGEKKDIEDKLQELKKSLDKSKELKDSDKDILKTKKELENLRDKLKREDMERLAGQLEKRDLTEKLAQEVLNADKENISKEIKNIEEKFKNMDKLDLKKAIKDLEELAKSIEDEDIEQAIESLADNLNENIDKLQASDISSDLANLSDELSDSLSSGTSSSQALSNSISKLEGMVSTGYLSDQDGQGQAGQAGGIGKSNSGSGSSSGDGSGSGSGSGSGAGSGSSDGQGNGGSSGSSESNASKAGNDGGVKDYEKIHAPKNQDGEGYDTQVSGSKGDQGDVDTTQVKKFGDRAGEEIPYNEVLKEYRQSAYEKIKTEDIPSNMKEIVKKYFISLE